MKFLPKTGYLEHLVEDILIYLKKEKTNHDFIASITTNYATENV